MSTIVAFFESAIDTPLTAPANTPTIRIRRTDTQALVVTDLAMTEQGDGNFSFDFSPTDGIEYAARSDGDPTVSGQTIAGARYAYGSLSGTTEARIEVGIPDILADTAAMQPLVDVAISTRSTLAQADILNDATPFAGADIDAAISSRAVAGDAMDLTGGALSNINSNLSLSHGAGSWSTATGFAVPGDAMTLTAGERTAIDTELTAAHGAGAWDGTASAAVVQAGLTAQGYTTARAPLLDNLDAAVSTRSTLAQADILNDATPFAGADIDAAISTRSSHSAADVDTLITASHGAGNYTTATGFAVPGDAMTLTAGERTAIDTELTAAHGAGAWDGTASAAVVQAGLTAQGYTTGRAPLLDNLDAAISTRSSHSAADVDTLITASHGAGNYTTATGFAVAGDAMTLTAGERTAIDTTLSTAHGAGLWDSATVPIADIQAGMTAQGYTTARAPLLDNLDVAVSTRSSHSAADVDTLITASHGAGNYTTATGFAVAGDAMTLTAGERTAIDTELATAHGAGAWDGTASIADIQAGLDANGYTIARSTSLDNLDAAISGIDAVLTASHGAGSWAVGASLSGAVDEIHAALGLTLGSPASFDSATGITVPAESIDVVLSVVGTTVTLTRQP